MPPSSVPSIRNDDLKILHAMLLSEFRPDLVRSFWEQQVLEIRGRRLSVDETLGHIWDEKKRSPLDFVMRVYNGLEPFLVRNHRDALTFVNALYNRSATMGSMVAAQKALSVIEPLIPELFKRRDLRHFLLDNLAAAHKLTLPEIPFRLIRHVAEGDWFSAIAKHNFSERYSRDLPYMDGELFLGLHLKWLPRSLGLQPFEKISPMADCREIEKIVDPAWLQTSGTRVLMKGEEIGVRADFHDFCKARLVQLDESRIPRREVVVVSRDYFCPQRRRVVLHRQCCYGAPVYLNRIVYRKSTDAPVNPLSGIISSANDPAFWGEAERLHFGLIETTRPKIRLEYHAKKESMTINGQKLVRGVPAKILRKVVIAHSTAGQKTFRHKEFISDSSVIADAYDANFVIRLQRLTATLEKKAPGLGLTKTAPGEFVFVPAVPYSYSQID